LIEAEGKEEEIELFTEWCRSGPDWAYVEDISVSECPVVGYEGFGIK
jgi:acylphosphatase